MAQVLPFLILAHFGHGLYCNDFNTKNDPKLLLTGETLGNADCDSNTVISQAIANARWKQKEGFKQEGYPDLGSLCSDSSFQVSLFGIGIFQVFDENCLDLCIFFWLYLSDPHPKRKSPKF